MPEEELPSGYEARSIQFLEVWRPGGWTVKIYGVSSQDAGPDANLIAAGRELALQRLPRPAVTEYRYGIGMLIGQEGEDGNYVRVGWWIRKHHLKSYIYRAEPGRYDPGNFHDVTQTGLTASLWDLHLLQFERRAWIASVLDRDAGPKLDEYLMQIISGDRI